MGDRIVNGARLTAQSWGVLRENRRLLVFPLVSGLVLTLVTASFVAAIVGTGVLGGLTGPDEQARTGSTILGLIELFLFYLVCYFVVIFSNTALVGAVLRLAAGQTATVGDGFRVALGRLPRILVYALISATVGLLARTIAQSGRNSNNIVVAIVAAIVGSIIQGAWNLVVFFAIPVIVVEDLGTIASLKRSLAIFRQTWGESFTGQTVIGGISCLAYLVILVGAAALIALGAAIGAPALIVLAIVLAIVLFCVLALLSGAVNGVFQASLYRYATTGDAGRLIATPDAAAAFRGEGAPAGG